MSLLPCYLNELTVLLFLHHCEEYEVTKGATEEISFPLERALDPSLPNDDDNSRQELWQTKIWNINS